MELFVYNKVKQIRVILWPCDGGINDAAPVKHVQMRPEAVINLNALQTVVGRHGSTGVDWLEDSWERSRLTPQRKHASGVNPSSLSFFISAVHAR